MGDPTTPLHGAEFKLMIRLSKGRFQVLMEDVIVSKYSFFKSCCKHFCKVVRLVYTKELYEMSNSRRHQKNYKTSQLYRSACNNDGHTVETSGNYLWRYETVLHNPKSSMVAVILLQRRIFPSHLEQKNWRNHILVQLHLPSIPEISLLIGGSWAWTQSLSAMQWSSWISNLAKVVSLDTTQYFIVPKFPPLTPW
jgi:hypothetical protein